MDNNPTTEAQAKKLWQGILDSAIAVITKPADFFRNMVKSGGFGDPLIFLLVMGVIAGVLQAILGLVHLVKSGSTLTVLAAIVYMPVAVLIGGFIGAAILFVIWKLMGSSESYETAYRCGAYAAATLPIGVILGIIPFAGSLIGLAWMLFLLVTASVEVHKIAAKNAWMVFGIITAILALMTTCGQIKTRRAQKQMRAFGQEFGNPGKEMTPEEAAKMSAAMMQAMQAEMAKQAKDAQKAAEEKSE